MSLEKKKMESADVADNVDGTTVVKTCCQLCIACCGMNAHVKDGKIVKVTGMPEHPISRGKLCPKGASAVDYVYSPNRLKYPMKKENGEWKRITWDEALDILATQLTRIKERYGPKGLAIQLGQAASEEGVVSYQAHKSFGDVYGTPNSFNVDSLCYRAKILGNMLTLGRMVIAQPKNAKCVVFWGTNPTNSCLPNHWDLLERRKEVKLIVIDPLRTYWAERADIHLSPRPGTDCALALGMLNVIVAEGLYDKDIVDNYTVGFDKLVEHVKDYPLERVESITGVPAEDIRRATRLFAGIRPASIKLGWNGTDQNSSGVQTARAVATIEAITGNFDVAGGLITPPPFIIKNIRHIDMLECLPLGVDEFPLNWKLHGRIHGEGQGLRLSGAILNDDPYPVRGMIIIGCNMLRTWPNTPKTRAMLEKLDFLAVLDIFMTETAEMADLVLPAPTFLEREEVQEMYAWTAGEPYVMLRKKVIDPGECWQQTKLWLELAKRMGYQEYFPWKDVEEMFDYILEPMGLTVKYLREEKPEGLFYGDVQYGRSKHGVRTPSGKIEIYSETLEKMGLPPLPTHMEPAESPVGTPDLAAEYPLVLTTGAREREYIHSVLREMPHLKKRRPNPIARIHPETASRYGISDGDRISIETKRGAIEMLAGVTTDIIPEVVSIPHAWPGNASANLITDDTPVDPISGFAALKAGLCRVRRV